MGQNRTATARMLEGLGNVQLNAKDPSMPPQSPIDLSSLGELRLLQPPPKNPADELQSMGDLDFPSPERKATADELSSLGPVNVRDVVHNYPKPPGAPPGFGQASAIDDPNIPESVANEDPSPIQTITSTSHWNVPSRGNMEPFAHMGARALAKLKGLIPQRTPAPPEPAGPPPKSPDAPSAFTQAPQMGSPNIPYPRDDDTIVNDDPNAGIRAQLSQIDPKTAPSVLQGLRNAGGMDESKLMSLNDRLRDEEAVNLSKGYSQGSLLLGDRANYGFGTGANPEHIRQLNSDLAPLDQYRKQNLDYSQRQYEAGVGGFKSPQEAAGFGQALESRKATAPTDVAKIQAQGNVDVQKLKDQGYEDFFIKMMTANAAGMPPGLSIRGPNGIGLAAAPVSPGASAAAEKSIEQLNRELTALENPSVFNYANPDMYTGQREAMIKAKKAELAAAQARATGRPMAPAPVTQSSGMNHVEVGTRDTIRGVPVVWDGQGWAKAE